MHQETEAADDEETPERAVRVRRPVMDECGKAEASPLEQDDSEMVCHGS